MQEKITEKKLKEELANIKSVVTIKWPLFASLLRKCRIIADPSIETAGINIENEMRVNPAFFQRLDDKAKVFVYSHEIMHIAFCHFQRAGEKIPWIFNLAADSVINELLFAHGFKDVQLLNGLVTPKKVAAIVEKKEEEIIGMGVEGQYHLLEKCLKGKEPLFNFMNDLSGKRSDKGKVIQEGDPQAYKPGITKKEIEKYWKSALTKAAVQAKMAGKLPADAELIINGLLKAKVDWKSVIKKMILNGLGKNAISTWKKTSRKHRLLPGIKQFAKPNVRLLIDTSGSTVEMMPQFLGEIYSIVKTQGRGVIYPWDAKAYEPVELRRTVDLTRAIQEKKIRGGGGTMIAPVLEMVLKSMELGDILVVITDGAIFDIEKKATQTLLQKLAQKSNQAIFGSMDLDIAIPRKWKKVKIEAT